MREDEAFDVARFGVEVERFIHSDIGKYLIDRAEMDREKAVKDFKTVDVTNTGEITRIQNELNTPDRIVAWLTDAIQSGYAAHDALRASEAENGDLP